MAEGFVCGTHQAFIFQRGGLQFVAELTPLTSVRWQRIRDDVSSADVTVPTAECCEILSDLRTIKFELHVMRNGAVVWQGVITRIEYDWDETRIYAEDILWVARRSIIETGYSNAYPNIGLALDRMDWLMRQCYERQSDPWHVLPHLRKLVGRSGPRTSRNVFDWQMTIWEDFDKFAEDYGCDYVVINRDIFYFDVHLFWYTIPDLDESHVSDLPRVVEYGNQAGTRGIVTNAHGHAGVSDPHPAVIAEWGLIDQLTTNEIDGQPAGDPTPEELAQWKDTATRSVSGTIPPPVSIVIPANTTLLPGSPWEMRHLVPGAWFRANVTRVCRQVVEWQRLHEVVVTEKAPDGERVNFTAVSAPADRVDYGGTPVVFPSDPPTWIPTNPPLPYVPIVPVPCVQFTDTFERADGPIGPIWETPPSGYFDVTPFSVVGGAAVCAEDLSATPGTEGGWARTVDSYPGDHFIETQIMLATPGSQDFYVLEVRRSATDGSAIIFYVEGMNPANWYWTVRRLDETGGDTTEYGEDSGMSFSYPLTLRVESLTDGSLTASINGTVVFSDVVDILPGDRVSFGCSWTAGTPPQFLSVTAGCLE